MLFNGATGDKTCPSELRGASYATSKVTVDTDKIISWYHGFNAEGSRCGALPWVVMSLENERVD